MIILGLSIIPCTDEVAIKSGVNGAAQWVRSTHEQSDVPHPDSCSPFCTCSCCAGVSFPMQQAVLPGVAENNNADHASYIAAGMIDISLPIWQPPQLLA